MHGGHLSSRECVPHPPRTLGPAHSPNSCWSLSSPSLPPPTPGPAVGRTGGLRAAGDTCSGPGRHAAAPLAEQDTDRQLQGVRCLEEAGAPGGLQSPASAITTHLWAPRTKCLGASRPRGCLLQAARPRFCPWSGECPLCLVEEGLPPPQPPAQARVASVSGVSLSIMGRVCPSL